MSNSDTLRVLIAEDHPLYRKGMISLLQSISEFGVVGEAATGEEAVARCPAPARRDLDGFADARGERHRGDAIFSPAVAARVLAYFSKPAPPRVFPTLTDREREILNLIAQGHSNPSIARQLSLSTKTVGNYVSNIFTKLQVADRAQAIIRAREAGMG
jgi:DNA-binding NarL/FixJ family response regulator